ncbi:MAG TPA: tetratricopeptide repeat protein [Pyrinomonadaceae bacterium]|nr:tetratricopeptide repeat protein [Pyrinomonadaceae bacterium]
MKTENRDFRQAAARALAVLVCAAALALCATARPQDPSPEPAKTLRGVSLYRKGDTKGAAEVLRAAVGRDETDADAWHYLGLSLEREGDAAGAAQALEQAVKWRFQRFFWVNPSASRRGDYSVHFDERFADAVESLEKFLELRPEAAGEWRERLEDVRFYARFYREKKDGSESRVAYSPDEVTTPVVIRSRPEPAVEPQRLGGDGGSGGYAVEAVVLLVTYDADGSVRHVIPVQPAGPRYTRAFVEAVLRTRFEPAIKGRRVVSVVAQVY